MNAVAYRASMNGDVLDYENDLDPIPSRTEGRTIKTIIASIGIIFATAGIAHATTEPPGFTDNSAPQPAESSPNTQTYDRSGGDHNKAGTYGPTMLIPGVPCDWSPVYQDCQ